MVRTFDIKTYVIGMGDSVANDKSVAALNEMAQVGRDRNRVSRELDDFTGDCIRVHRRGHSGKDEQRVSRGSQCRIMELGFARLPSQVQQCGLVGQCSGLSDIVNRCDHADAKLGSRRKNQAAVGHSAQDHHVQAIGKQRGSVPVAQQSGVADDGRTRCVPNREPQHRCFRLERCAWRVALGVSARRFIARAAQLHRLFGASVP